MDFPGIIDTLTGGSPIGDIFDDIFGNGGPSEPSGNAYGGSGYPDPSASFGNMITGFLPIIIIGIVLLLVLRK